MNSYWILWLGRLRRARSELARWAVSAIFEKWHVVIKPYFLLFEARISCVFLIFLLRSIKAYLCPNMINFDAVDFSERHPEEVISFFWRSVYIVSTFSITPWFPPWKVGYILYRPSLYFPQKWGDVYHQYSPPPPPDLPPVITPLWWVSTVNWRPSTVN